MTSTSAATDSSSPPTARSPSSEGGSPSAKPRAKVPLSDPNPVAFEAMRWLCRIMSLSYFQSVEVVGEHNVPSSGPTILYCNHPNALIDGMLVMAYTRRILRVVAKDTLFPAPLLGQLLRLVGAVPVKRRIDYDESSTVDNADAFSSLYEALERGGCVVIFPEGISFHGSHLNELRTGAARIALGVAARTHGRVRPRLVPCGLNYSNPSRFRSRAMLNYGSGLSISDALLELYRQRPGEAVHQLTDSMTRALREVTVNTEDWPTLRAVHTLRRVLRTEGRPSFAEQFDLTQRFVDALAAAPDDLRSVMDVYQLWLEVCRLRDDVLRRDLGTASVLLLLLVRAAGLALLVPIAAPFIALHAPILIAASGAGRIALDKEVVSTLQLGTATLLTMLLYTLLFALAARRSPRLALLAVLVLPLCGVAALRCVDAARAAARSLGPLWRLLWLRHEAAAARQMRMLLQAHAKQLLQHHEKRKAQEEGSDGGSRPAFVPPQIRSRL